MVPDHNVIKTNATGELYLEDDTGRVTRLYRFREALDRAQIDVATYYQWVMQGKLQDVRLRDHGRWRVFTESDVNKLVAVSRQEGRGRPIWGSTDTDETGRGNWREAT